MTSSCCSLNVTPTLVLDEIIALSGEIEIPKVMKIFEKTNVTILTIQQDIMSHGTWSWPISWYTMFLVLNYISIPNLIHEQIDTLFWKLNDWSLSSYSVRHTWQSVRDRVNEVAWSHIVWSRYTIPHHAIHLWLVIRRRLLTQDRMRQWDVGKDIELNLLCCPFCNTQPDSHEHLLFECSFSSQVWDKVLHMADIGFFRSGVTL
nr:hypothetical protein [Tanacetum cinerariifolium]